LSRRRCTYRVLVDGRPWGDGDLLDWSVERATLVSAGGRYDNRFRTFPPIDAPAPVSFAVLGDFGVGIVDGRLDGLRQLQLAHALQRAVDARDVRLVITTGDNIYLGHQDTAGTGNEDDEWYSSFYQPYRYVLNRVPFFPTVGNHDAGDSESSDDRDQLADNLFLDHRFRPEIETGSASLGPGLFYRFQVGANLEFISIDTSIASGMDVEHYFDDPGHRRWVEETLRGDGARWRVPFSLTRRSAPGRSTPTRREWWSGWCRCSTRPASGSCSVGTSTTSSTRSSAASTTW
jgi:tartrate-resistant acid phosphatase type 5